MFSPCTFCECSSHGVQSRAVDLGCGLTSVCCAGHLTQGTAFVLFCSLNRWTQALKPAWLGHVLLLCLRPGGIASVQGCCIRWFLLPNSKTSLLSCLWTTGTPGRQRWRACLHSCGLQAPLLPTTWVSSLSSLTCTSCDKTHRALSGS